MVGTSTLPPPRERVTLDQNHVDAMSGAVVLSFPLLSVGPDLYGLKLVAQYNSQGAWRDSFSGNLDLTLSDTQQSVSASWGAQAWSFAGQSGSSTSGDGTTLSSDASGNFLLTLRDGTVVTHSLLTTPQNASCPSDSVCQIYYFPIQVVYPNGVIVTPNYRVYVGPSPQWLVRVQSVTNNAGYQIKYTYQSNDPTASVAWQTQSGAVAINSAVEYCNPTADTCSLDGSWPTVTYSSGTNTFTITDALNRATRFTYSTTSLKVKTAASTTDNLQYAMQSYADGEGLFVRRVTSATVGSSTWTYGYVQSPSQGAFYTLTTTATDPLSHSSVYISGRRDVPLGIAGVHPAWALNSIQDPLNRTTAFGYPCTGNGYFNSDAYSIWAPEGNGVTRTCDNRGNVTTVDVVSKTDGLCHAGRICTSQTFPSTCSNAKTCNQPTAVFDGRGAETDYSYDPNHGGVLIETLPAVNGVRPQKRYGYAQFYAYVKNASGTLVQAASPVWMPTQVSECHSLNSCTGTSDEVVTSFEYAAAGTINRLLVRGKVVTSASGSLRTCYGYDALGNQVSVTTPRAGLSSCP
jgi:hypothetical protein